MLGFREQWAEMRGGFVVTEEEADEIAMYSRSRRAKSSREAIAQVRARVHMLLRLKGAPECMFCGDRIACVCEPCILQSRGAFCCFRTRVETRTDDEGVEFVRVATDLCWSDSLDGDFGPVAAVYSEWHQRDETKSSIAGVVSLLEQVRAAQS